ncbi:MAG: T9SS type A sorting domain-containing protein, partial [Bacteroidota bacterium]|nr:T9SS type A sorting domain-containing protein [Bacteroidota bacterium]
GEDNVSRISMTDENNGFIIAQVFNQTTGQIESWAMRKTTDGGANWDPITIDEADQPSDVSAVPGEPGMIVAVKISQTTDENKSMYSLDSGDTWTQMDDSVQYTCVQMLDINTGWAGGFNQDENIGGIYKWPGMPGSTPYFTSTPVTEIGEEEAYTYNVTAEDPNALELTFMATEIPAWLTLTDNGDGTADLSGTAPDITTASESYDVSLKVSNTDNDTATQAFTIDVLQNNIADFGYGEVNIYPNPSAGQFVIENCQDVDYKIYTCQGRVVENGTIENAIFRLNLNKQKQGIYFLRLTKENQDAMIKLQIVK